MSIVAWDGKAIAADKQGTCMGQRFIAIKMRRLAHANEVIAWTGFQDYGQVLAKWYEDGADPEKWPAFQADKDDWVRLIVMRRSGVEYYERSPVPIQVHDKFQAWGSGRDYALGAMAMGASAKKAVKIAMCFDNQCGLGVDVATLR